VNEDESKKLAAYLMSATAPAAGGAAPAAAPGKPAAAAGGETFEAIVQSHNCWVCHTIPDVANAKGIVGPDLKGLMSRPKIVGGLLDTNEANLRKWLSNPQAVKAATAMVLPKPLTPAQIDTVVKHLMTYK